MLQVEEVRSMSNRLQLRGDGAHDRDDSRVAEAIVDGTQGVDSRHASSHIKSRVSRSATGLFDECASVCAWRMRCATVAGSSSRMIGILNAVRTDSVTAPPSVCHGSRSPNVPRSLISITSGTRYNCAPETMPLIAARKPWFCI